MKHCIQHPHPLRSSIALESCHSLSGVPVWVAVTGRERAVLKVCSSLDCAAQLGRVGRALPRGQAPCHHHSSCHPAAGWRAGRAQQPHCCLSLYDHRDIPLRTPPVSSPAPFSSPASFGGEKISSLICNFLSFSCPYFLLFTAVAVKEFQEVNLLSVFTDVSSTSCPFLKQICFLWRCSAPFHGPSGSSATLSRAVAGLRNTLVKFWLDMCCRVPACSGKVWHRGFLHKKHIYVEKEARFL